MKIAEACGRLAGWRQTQAGTVGAQGRKVRLGPHGRLGGGRGAPYRLRHSHTCALRTAVAQVGGCHAVGSSNEGLRSVVARRSDDGPAKDFISDAEGWAARRLAARPREPRALLQRGGLGLWCPKKCVVTIPSHDKCG